MFWAAEEPPEGHQVFCSSLVSFMYTEREIVEGKPWLHQERASEPPPAGNLQADPDAEAEPARVSLARTRKGEMK